jgi:2-iminobutanoate/2-iminopropanoate deaminase
MTGRPEPVVVPQLAPTGSAWSQATVAGDFVHLSGQVAIDPSGSVIGVGSVEEQTEAVFANIEHALKAAGSSLDRLARIGCYLTDISHVDGFRAVRDRRLEGIRPASTLVIVAALVIPELLVEIDAVALRA